MRRFRLPMGRIFGIRLWLHASWFLVFGLVAWAVTVAFGEAYPGLPLPERLAMAVVTGLAFFACLILHELSHALVARRFGVAVRGITLFVFGGVAEIGGEVPTPAREFAVALAGPGASLALAAILALLSRVAGAARWAPGEGVLITLALVNLGVAVFNLVPGLPLDGGRLLRAGLWRITGDHRKATRIAAAGGGLVALALAALGLVVIATGDPVGLWYVAMAVFLWPLARMSGRVLPPAPPPQSGLALEDREGQAAQSGP